MVDCPNCGEDLTYLKQYDRYFCYHCKKYAPKGYGKAGEVKCTICGRPASYIAQYDRYYCYHDKVYVKKAATPKVKVEAKATVVPAAVEAPLEEKLGPADVENPCPTCGADLTYILDYNRWYCHSCKNYAPLGYVPPGRKAEHPCPTCGNEMTYVEKFDRWYCYNCKVYAPKEVAAEPAPLLAAEFPGVETPGETAMADAEPPGEELAPPAIGSLGGASIETLRREIGVLLAEVRTAQDASAEELQVELNRTMAEVQALRESLNSLVTEMRRRMDELSARVANAQPPPSSEEQKASQQEAAEGLAHLFE